MTTHDSEKDIKTDIFSYASLPQEKLQELFQTSLSDGLSQDKASTFLQKDGLNEISANQVQWWEIAIRQFTSPFIYLLLIAAVIVYAIGEHIDAGIIVGFVFINAALGFYQEYKSEQSLRALEQFISPRSRVKRDNNWQVIDSRNLVRGDIISLMTGDAIPADLRVLKTSHFIVNETTLTGESVPVLKQADTLPSVPKNIYESHNLLFSGTSVVEGEATALVLETGERTTMGRIAKLTVETTKESEFSKGISRFSSFILRMILITLVFIFLANLVIKGENADIFELVVFCIALVVSVVPEALPVVTTVSLSRGALQLAKHEVIVKRLTAIEDIGSIEVLCSDKTGTLTENSLSTTGYSPDTHPTLLSYAALTIAETVEKTEPFDIAIEKEASDRQILPDESFKRLMELPFDPVRRRNAVLIRNEKETIMVVRGAPEVIIALSSLSNSEKAGIEKWISDKGNAGERTIAIAKRIFPGDKEKITPEDEQDLQFLGVMAFADPIKPSTFHAVKKAKELGVAIKIITGDSPEVAGAVGVKIGLLEDPTMLLTGSVLQDLPENERAEEIIRHTVIARVTPEQKYEIIKILQRSFTVGFLGEGINDAPALKLAGVSMVVESAADIAREAADIILLQKNLEVIMDGIESGRGVFANSVKYLKATLASNFGHFYAIAIGSMFISFLPMLPIQILLVNLLSDFPMISIATDTVDKDEVKKPRKYELREIMLVATLLGVVVTVFDLMFFAFFIHEGDKILQTNWFVGSILTELVFLFSIRTKLPFFQAERPSRYVILLTGIAAFATVLLPYTVIGEKLFHFYPPSAMHLGIILILVAAFFVCSELVKHMYYRYTG
ncbi:MAG: HAD-IC family P-type ATPase [Methanomicrobiales archaeon]|nr:HAD-IC family P-type ATPase [Methanomicrobiales archaeon]